MNTYINLREQCASEEKCLCECGCPQRPEGWFMCLLLWRLLTLNCSRSGDISSPPPTPNSFISKDLLSLLLVISRSSLYSPGPGTYYRDHLGFKLRDQLPVFLVLWLEVWATLHRLRLSVSWILCVWGVHVPWNTSGGRGQLVALISSSII